MYREICDVILVVGCYEDLENKLKSRFQEVVDQFQNGGVLFFFCCLFFQFLGFGIVFFVFFYFDVV